MKQSSVQIYFFGS